MKVKNIAFSGFAAAILSGVGAAQAVTVSQLVTPNYVDKAIEGKVSGVEERVDVLEGQMGEEALSTRATTVTGAINELNGVVTKVGTIEGEKTVAELLDEKQDVLANATVLENITADDLTAIGTIADKADTSDVEAALELKADKTAIADLATQTAVTNAIATALQTAKDYADANDADTIYVDTELRGLISANATAIEGKAAKATTLAGYGITDAYTKTEVDDKVAEVVAGDMDEALEAYAKTETVNAALELKANSADVYTKEQADAAIKAYADANDADTVYDDTGVRGLISTNATNIATNTEDIADNAGAISALQANKMVIGPDGDGLWLANKSGDTITWKQVEILDTYSTGDENL